MKKVLTLILALALVLSLSATAFAASNDITDGSTAGADVNAKKIHTLSATVTWETMYFVYDSGLGTWTNTDSSGVATSSGSENNVVKVSNNSAVSIKVNAKYETENSYANYGAQAFDSETLSFATGDTAGTSLSSSFTTVFNSLAANTDSDFWFMFTTDGSALGNGFAKVGTLTIGIADVNP